MAATNRQRAGLRAGCRRRQAAADVAPGRLGCSGGPAATRGWLRAPTLLLPAARQGDRAAQNSPTGLAQRASRQLLDVAQIGPLLVAAERDRGPGGPGPRGSADAVHVIFGHVRQFEI